MLSLHFRLPPGIKGGNPVHRNNGGYCGMDGLTMDLSGKNILITGTTSGLGRHFAELLAGAGARVAATGRRQDRLESLCAEIAAKGGKAFPFVLDVLDTESIRQVVEAAETKLGPLDILINNAGVNGAGRILESDAASSEFNCSSTRRRSDTDCSSCLASDLTAVPHGSIATSLPLLVWSVRTRFVQPTAIPISKTSVTN